MQHNKAAWRTGLQLDGTPAHNDEHYDDSDDDDHDYDHEDDHDHDQDQEDVDNSDPMR